MISDPVTSHQGDILIVDDLPDNLRLLRDTLSEEGYKVRSATTGAMALRAAQSPSTELILLDIKLPDLDGYEVCRKLKSDERTADIPVIFLSALSETLNKVQGLAAGGVDYISKPFQVQEVLARVAIHLTIRRLQKSLQQQNLRLIQEIEEHQHLKEILFAEKELAQVTLQSIGDAVITTDAQGNIRYFNPVAEKLTGWKAQEAQGLSLSEVFIIINEVVNDTVGHIAGDELLRQITAVLQQGVRANDQLARLGGDEFGLLLTQCPLSQAAQIAEILKDKVRQFRFIWNGKTFIIGVSIGVVAINKTNPDLMEILGAADAACYAAKAKGRNCIHIYHQDDGELIKQRAQRQLIAKISRALETHRFCLYYQRIVSINSKPLLEHYEILIRMLDENGELVSPNTFIPAAERYGLITDIDCWVIETFFSNYKKLSDQKFIKQGLYAINLSGASICNNGFLEFLIEQFPRHQIPPQTICFEITETAAIANFDKARYFMGELKQIGCRFALDDFGSGLSSFAYLINLPVDYLKIDGTFVKDINHNSVSQAIVEGFNRIAHAMNLETVAEFVEDESILEKLREIGVDYAQGYGISHPIPINFHQE
jgi:diguanylate cyclase (GGDEF)-like protein